MVDSIRIIDRTINKHIDLDKFSAMFLLDNEGVDWGVVTPTINSYPSIYGLGSKVSNITFQKARVITITGWIINDNTGTITQKKKVLNQFVNPLNDIEIQVIGKYYISGVFTNSVKYTNKRKENNETGCKFQLSVTCSDPFFRLIKPLVYKNIEPAPRLPYRGWRFDINNTSGITYGFEMYVKFAEGKSTPYFTVQNLTLNNGKYTKVVSGTVLSGNIYLNTVKGNYSFGNVDSVPTEEYPEEFNKLFVSSSDFEFVQLIPGNNTIAVSCGITADLEGCSIDVYFNPVFLGFEEM